MSITPATPAASDQTIATVNGHFGSGCEEFDGARPTAQGSNGTTIRIDFYTREPLDTLSLCMTLLVSWPVEHVVGRLPVGSYAVRACQTTTHLLDGSRDQATIFIGSAPVSVAAVPVPGTNGPGTLLMVFALLLAGTVKWVEHQDGRRRQIAKGAD